MATAAAASTARQVQTGGAPYASVAVKARHPVTTTKCGKYTIVRGTWAGGPVSPDPRLAGVFVLDARLRMNGGGNGVATGTVSARDGRGRTRFKATLRAVVSERTTVQGTVNGRLIGPNEQYRANMTVAFDPRYTVGGVRLGLGASTNSAVSYSGCKKPRR